MQTKQIHVRLTEEEISTMEAIAADCDVNSSLLGRFFIRAALRAVKAYSERIRLPIDFQVIEDASSRTGAPALASPARDSERKESAVSVQVRVPSARRSGRKNVEAVCSQSNARFMQIANTCLRPQTSGRWVNARIS